MDNSYAHSFVRGPGFFLFFKGLFSQRDHWFTRRMEALENSSISNPLIWLWLSRNIIQFIYLCSWIAGGKNGGNIYVSRCYENKEVFSEKFVLVLKKLLEYWCYDCSSNDIIINGKSVKNIDTKIETPKFTDIKPIYLRIFLTEIVKNSLALLSNEGHRRYKIGTVVHINITESEINIYDELEKPYSEKEKNNRVNSFKEVETSILDGYYNYQHRMTLSALSYYMYSAGYNVCAGFEDSGFVITIKKN